MSKTKIAKQVSLSNNLNFNSCFFEFTPTETYASSTFFTLLMIYHINVVMTQISLKNELESTFIEIADSRKSNVVVGVIYRHSSLSLPEFNYNY